MKTIYFPTMSLPHDNPAIGSALLFSTKLSIIAPRHAFIGDVFTERLIEAGAVERIDPIQELSEKQYRSIGTRLEKFIKKRGSDFSRDSSRISRVHLDKIRAPRFDRHSGEILQSFQVHAGKVGVEINQMLIESGIATKNGYYLKMPEPVAMYIMGLLTKEIVSKKKYIMISSTGGVGRDRADYGNVLFDILKTLSFELMPSLDLRNGIECIDDIIYIRERYQRDLENYVSRLHADINRCSENALNDLRLSENLDRLEVKHIIERIEDSKKKVISRYSSDFKELSSAIEGQKRLKFVKGKVTPFLLNGLAVYLANKDPISSAILLGVANLGSEFLPDDREISVYAKNQRVIYDINRR